MEDQEDGAVWYGAEESGSSRACLHLCKDSCQDAICDTVTIRSGKTTSLISLWDSRTFVCRLTCLGNCYDIPHKDGVQKWGAYYMIPVRLA